MQFYQKKRENGVQKIKKIFWGTPIVGSLEVPEHEKNGVYALFVAKLFWRPNLSRIFYTIFPLNFKPMPFSPGTSYTTFQKRN